MAPHLTRFPLNHPPLRLTTFTPKVLVLLQQEQRSRTACPQSMGRSSYSMSCVLCPTAPLCSGESPACRPRAAWPGALSPCPPPSIASRSHSASPSISPFRAPAPHPRPGGPGAPVPAHPPSSVSFGAPPSCLRGVLGAPPPQCYTFSQRPLLGPGILIVITSGSIGCFSSPPPGRRVSNAALSRDVVDFFFF